MKRNRNWEVAKKLLLSFCFEKFRSVTKLALDSYLQKVKRNEQEE